MLLINIDGIVLNADVAEDYELAEGEALVEEGDERIAGYSSISGYRFMPQVLVDLPVDSDGGV